MSDEELMATVREMMLQRIAEEYTKAALEQLNQVPEPVLVQQLGGMMMGLSGNNEALADLYDAHMPPTHSDSDYKTNLRLLGKVSSDTPSTINIYAATFEAKDIIAEEIKNYNSTRDNEDDQITYTDYVALLMSSVATIIDVISYVLIAFVSISLVVSSIMIGIITYISVLERTKEIGILRAIGSRSNDVFMIFFAESFIISMINFVLALFTTGAVVYVINGIFREEIGLLITFLTLGIRQVGLLLGVSLLVATIATFFPVKKIASMKPIDAIKNRK
jgi:putative ABC transport system permease protein